MQRRVKSEEPFSSRHVCLCYHADSLQTHEMYDADVRGHEQRQDGELTVVV